MPKGAFLQRPAPTIQDLKREVKTNNVVCVRYARLFHLSPTMARLAVSQMHLTRLTQDRPLNVYYIHPGEHIGYKLRRVRKGTLIWALPDGTPALMEVCGNPLRDHVTASLETPESSLPGLPDFSPREPLGALPTPTAITFGDMRNATPSAGTGTPTAQALSPVAISALPTPTLPAPAGTPSPAAASPSSVSASTPGFSGLGYLAALLPGLLALLPDSGGASAAVIRSSSTPSYSPTEATNVASASSLPITPAGLNTTQQTQTAINQIHNFFNNNTTVAGGGGGGGASANSGGSLLSPVRGSGLLPGVTLRELVTGVRGHDSPSAITPTPEPGVIATGLSVLCAGRIFFARARRLRR